MQHALNNCAFTLKIHCMFALFQDIDECSLKIDNCGEENATTCINTAGSYECCCKQGYEKDANGTCVGKFYLK